MNRSVNAFCVNALLKKTLVSLWIGDRLVRVGLCKGSLYLRQVPFCFWSQLCCLNWLKKSAYQLVLQQPGSFRHFDSLTPNNLYDILNPMVLVDYRVENHGRKRPKWRRIRADRLEARPWPKLFKYPLLDPECWFVEVRLIIRLRVRPLTCPRPVFFDSLDGWMHKRRRPHSLPESLPLPVIPRHCSGRDKRLRRWCQAMIQKFSCLGCQSSSSD